MKIYSLTYYWFENDYRTFRCCFYIAEIKYVSLTVEAVT